MDILPSHGFGTKWGWFSFFCGTQKETFWTIFWTLFLCNYNEWDFEDLKRLQKQLKSGLYELYTMFQVFWSHMRALCEEQTEIKTIFTDNLPLQWTVIHFDLISEPVSWSLGQMSIFKELNCVFCTQGYYMTSEVYEYSMQARWTSSVMHLWCFLTILLLDKLTYFHC